MKRLDDKVRVSGQMHPGELAALAAEGVTMIVNNRPDDEEPEQPAQSEIEAAANAAGLDYRYIPVGGGLSANQVEAMREALGAASGEVLAFCRSGTRSTYLWALARARDGADPETLAARAAEAGYDLTPIRPYLG